MEKKTYWEFLAEAVRKHVPTYRDQHGIWRHDGGFEGCDGEIIVSERNPSGQMGWVGGEIMRAYTSTGTCLDCGVEASRCEPVSAAAEKAGLFPWTRHDQHGASRA